MFVDYLFILVESVSHYRCLLPYWRGEPTFENPKMKIIVYICLMSCAIHYIHEPMEALSDPCVSPPLRSLARRRVFRVSKKRMLIAGAPT